jgi:hypothetical protein
MCHWSRHAMNFPNGFSRSLQNYVSQITAGRLSDYFYGIMVVLWNRVIGYIARL